jgi:hypothetical protein
MVRIVWEGVDALHSEVVPLINALAWPIAIVVLSVLFRREIGQAAGRLGQLKFRELEVTFREDLRQAEALAQSIPGSPKLAPVPGRVLLEADEDSGPTLGGTMIVGGGASPEEISRDEGKDRPAPRSPREAIAGAWADLGAALVRAASSLADRKSPAPTRPADAARFLSGRGWLVGDEARLFVVLEQLRERADHYDGVAIGPDEARRFVELSSRLTARIIAKT